MQELVEEWCESPVMREGFNRLKTRDLPRNNTIFCTKCTREDIIQTKEGYVCQKCGMVHDTLHLKPSLSYNPKKVHHAASTGTHLGTKIERRKSSTLSTNFERLKKVDFRNKCGTYTVNNKALFEINRIFEILHLTPNYKQDVFYYFKKIYAKLIAEDKFKNYRSADALIPLTIYYYLKFQNVYISEKELLEISKISTKKFKKFKLRMQALFPIYRTRDRWNCVYNLLLKVKNHFHLDGSFLINCKTIAEKVLKIIGDAKDEIVAGTIASLCSLCFYDYKISYCNICKLLGISNRILYHVNKITIWYRLPKLKKFKDAKGFLKKLFAKSIEKKAFPQKQSIKICCNPEKEIPTLSLRIKKIGNFYETNIEYITILNNNCYQEFYQKGSNG